MAFMAFTLYDTEKRLNECLKMLEGVSSKEAYIQIWGTQLADFVSNSKDKRPSLKRWVKDYLENEYPNLSFTVENEGALLSSTQVIKNYCELSDPTRWSWQNEMIKDDKGNWNIDKMWH